MSPVVSQLYFYPIKSCAGLELQVGQVTSTGFEFDRHWMIVDPEGNLITQREIPKMALIHPKIEDEQMVLRADARSDLVVVDVGSKGKRREVRVWKDYCQAIEEPAPVNQWLCEFLEIDCALVHMAEDFERKSKRGLGLNQFADSFPFMIMSQATLKDLNQRIQENRGTPLLMNRFRPNIVVGDCSPYAEDGWGKVCINGIEFVLVEACVRCSLTTVEQEDASKHKEPLKTLATYRRVMNNKENIGVILGQKTTNLGVGEIRVGDQVEILEEKDPTDHTILFG